MSETKPPEVGTISWADLTVEDAVTIRDFYSKVVDWPFEPVEMGKYSDFCMLSTADRQPKAGICHARGSNANLPAQWLIYITVADLEKSVRACVEHGGKVLSAPRSAGQGRFVVIQDPAGAVAALFESSLSSSS
jgi:predicted enzyme related to lactoylglutathione lyase